MLAVLPPARKEWDCKLCSQKIYQSDKEKFASGKFMILNSVDGIGGHRHMKHVCPNRLDSKFDHTDRKVNWRLYHWNQMNLPCGYCGERYNSYKNPLCPVCYRLECRACKNQQQWIYIAEQFPTRCYQCNHDKLDVLKLPK